MNNLSNVALWFSRDNEGNTVTIDKVNEEYKGEYICPLCGSEVITKAIDSDYMSAHFAHIDKSKCCGETMVHWWVKNELIKSGDEFIITTDEMNKFVCKSIEIEREYITQNGVYKPDITIYTECGKTIFVEINVSNKKNIDQYWDIWKELNNIVVEFNVRDVIEKDNVIKINNNFRAIYYEGKAFIDKENSDYKKYKKSIESNLDEEYIKSLNDIEWFIDDIYKYNKGIIDISELEAGYQEAINLGKNVIEKIYKNNRCSKALKDIIKYRDDILEEVKTKISNEFNASVSCSNNSNKRYISERLFNSNYIEVNMNPFKYEETDKRNIDSKIKYLYDIGMQVYGENSVKISNFSNILPYEKTQERILKLKDKILLELNSYEKIYDIVNKETYLCWATDRRYYFNFNGKIKEFVLSKLEELEFISKNDSNDWKYINKTTSKIIAEILENDYKYFENHMENIHGEQFINLDSYEVRNDIESIGNQLLKLKEEYSFIIKRCNVIEKIFKAFGYQECSIRVSLESGNSYTINANCSNLRCLVFDNGLIRINGLNICKTDLNNIDTFIRDFEVSMNYTADQGRCLLSKEIIELYEMILNRYTKENNYNYVVKVDKMSFVILGKYNEEISRFKYNSITTFEEVIGKFSKDIRNYLYVKGDKK